MKLLKQHVEILYCDKSFLKLIESAGRTCYKSEKYISENSYKKFIKGIILRGHESVIEHSLMTVRFITDRGISHELVRHRIAAFSQESTRYCNYSKQGVQFIVPFWYKNIIKNIDKINCAINIGWNNTEIKICCNELTEEEGYFLNFLQTCENIYNKLINQYNQKPEQARAVLPNCVKTELVMSANFREWRHILKLRMSSNAHRQMREIMELLYNKIYMEYPEIFKLFFKDIKDNK